MGIRKHIPNTITCLNLFSGSIASVMAFKGFTFYALLFILLAAVFDFFDGLSARALHVSSPIGKELDSLADMVSFGFAPSVVIYTQLTLCDMPGKVHCFLPFIAFLIAAFSALRLAKFNLDERQTCSFIGLATPANALFFVGLIATTDPLMPVASYIDRGWFGFLFNPYVVVVLIIIFSYLLISEIPMFSLKFKSLKWSDNKIRFIFLGIDIILLAALQLVALPFIILVYLLLSVTAYKE